MSSNNSCLCSKQIIFSSSTPIVTDKKNVFDFASTHCSPIGDPAGQKTNWPKSQHLFGQVKSMIDFYSPEYETKVNRGRIPENRPGLAHCPNPNGSIFPDPSVSLSSSVNGIIEQFTSKGIREQEIHYDEVRNMSLDHSIKLKSKDEEIDFLIKETHEIADKLEKTIIEKSQLELKFQEQSKFEGNILEENQLLRIDIVKEEIRSNDAIKNHIEENDTLKEMHDDIKRKLEKREEEVEVLRRNGDKEAEMDKSQIKNLQSVLAIAKFKLARGNGQFKNILKVKSKNFVKQDNPHIDDDFITEKNQHFEMLQKEKENHMLVESNFHSFHQNEKNKLFKEERKIEQERKDLLRQQTLLEVNLLKLENEKEKFVWYGMVSTTFCGILTCGVIFIYRRNN